MRVNPPASALSPTALLGLSSSTKTYHSELSSPMSEVAGVGSGTTSSVLLTVSISSPPASAHLTEVPRLLLSMPRRSVPNALPLSVLALEASRVTNRRWPYSSPQETTSSSSSTVTATARRTRVSMTSSPLSAASCCRIQAHLGPHCNSTVNVYMSRVSCRLSKRLEQSSHMTPLSVCCFFSIGPNLEKDTTENALL